MNKHKILTITIATLTAITITITTAIAFTHNAYAADSYHDGRIDKSDVEPVDRKAFYVIPEPILINNNKELSKQECEQLGFHGDPGMGYDTACKRYEGKYCFWVLDYETGKPITNADIPSADHLSWNAGPQNIGIANTSVIDENGTVCFTDSTVQNYYGGYKERMDMMYGSYSSWYFHFTGWSDSGKFKPFQDYGFDCDTTSMYVLKVPNNCKPYEPSKLMYVNSDGILAAIFLLPPDKPKLSDFAMTGSHDILTVVSAIAFALLCISIGILIPTGSEDKHDR